jgi:hypothetical protein
MLYNAEFPIIPMFSKKPNKNKKELSDGRQMASDQNL